MEISEKIIQTKDYLTKSNLPESDFVINPYVGCPHGCKYCYACFMKRFTNHNEEWGKFIDIKQCSKPISAKRLTGKSVFLSSVTDCYNLFEEKYCITQSILKQLVDIDCDVTITTKSKLILRDIELLKKFKSLTIAMSVNTTDEKFKDDMDNASSISDRLNTLKALHENGIYTVLFMSPIFPEITDFADIIERSRSFTDEYWFENLNLRGSYKGRILGYIERSYPQYKKLYEDIYIKGKNEYWQCLKNKIEDYCSQNAIKHNIYFYHEELVKNKIERSKQQR